MPQTLQQRGARYEYSRAIIHAHLRNRFNLPTVGNDVLQDLENLRDATNDVIDALRKKNGL